MNSAGNYRLPMEWIDRIFKRLAEAYGSKFAERFSNTNVVDLEKIRWAAGLYGCTSNEIKHVLDLCKQQLIHSPPTVIEFFHYCKRIRLPPAAKKPECIRTETGEQYLKLILDKLHGRIDSEGLAALSALDQQVLAKPVSPEPTHWQDK